MLKELQIEVHDMIKHIRQIWKKKSEWKWWKLNTTLSKEVSVNKLNSRLDIAEERINYQEGRAEVAQKVIQRNM